MALCYSSVPWSCTMLLHHDLSAQKSADVHHEAFRPKSHVRSYPTIQDHRVASRPSDRSGHDETSRHSKRHGRSHQRYEDVLLRRSIGSGGMPSIRSTMANGQNECKARPSYERVSFLRALLMNLCAYVYMSLFSYSFIRRN